MSEHKATLVGSGFEAVVADWIEKITRSNRAKLRRLVVNSKLTFVTNPNYFISYFSILFIIFLSFEYM